MKRGDPELTFWLKLKQGRETLHGFESDESSTPRKFQRTHPFNRLMIDGPTLSLDGHNDAAEKSTASSSGDENINNISPATPPIFNHSNARRRKGIPHRAPF